VNIKLGNSIPNLALPSYAKLGIAKFGQNLAFGRNLAFGPNLAFGGNLALPSLTIDGQTRQYTIYSRINRKQHVVTKHKKREEKKAKA
jgi:hypothetical protein